MYTLHRFAASKGRRVQEVAASLYLCIIEELALPHCVAVDPGENLMSTSPLKGRVLSLARKQYFVKRAFFVNGKSGRGRFQRRQDFQGRVIADAQKRQ
jgi:hypothetical protein